MKKVIYLFVMVMLVSGCASTSIRDLFIKDSFGNYNQSTKENFIEKENANIRLGLNSYNFKDDITIIKVKLFNKKNFILNISPENFLLTDKEKVVLPMVSPDDAVAISMGDVDPTNIPYIASNPTSYSYAGNTRIYGNTAYTTGTLTPSYGGGGGNWGNSFANSFNQSYARSAAMAPYYRALAIKNAKVDAKAKAFDFGDIQPNTAKVGNLYFYNNDKKYPLSLSLDLNGETIVFEITDKVETTKTQ